MRATPAVDRGLDVGRSRGAVSCNRMLYRRSHEPRQPERPRCHRRVKNPQSGAAATDRRCLITLADSTAVEMSTNVPNSPARQRNNGQPLTARADSAPLLDKSQWPRA